MSILDLFKSNSDEVIVKETRSKGPNRWPLKITVGDIKKGIVYDGSGYKNEIVLFLRKNKEDR